ncbi:MAG: flagellar hook-associated protein FlgK [Chloroflexota bacterium]|nr:flagellar hook-associated protein FlgK [Dehalococcoidia bacterium]MDW8254883.1 flagellar hook-associated protein FlgK [Chloroflexota bacterium]
MANGFSAIENGLSALRAFRAATETISHNLANAATEGYSRQEVMLAARPAVTYLGYGAISGPMPGNGVEVESIRRHRDAFLDRRYRAAFAEYGRLDITADTLARLELLFNEPTDSGIAAHLNRFFHAWQEVANAPEARSSRTVLLQRAQSLALRFNQAAGAIREEQTTLDLIVGERVREVNELAAQIATLNGKIIIARGLGQSPNDLMDQRDRLLDALSKLVGITTTEQANGAVDVEVGGRALVAGTAANAIAAVPPAPGAFRQVVWVADNAAVAVTTGEIAGAVALRDADLPGRLATLNALAGAIIAQVNALHTTGTDLTGAAGLPFFTGTDAATMALNPALASAPERVAAADLVGAPGPPPLPPESLPGGNRVALRLAALAEAATMPGGATFNGYWNTALAQLGVAVNAAKTDAASQEALHAQLTRERQSKSGVSLDEEAANLVRFQRAFEAVSHVISVVDSMLATIINEMGRTGR